MKGQQEALSAILITGILIGVVGSVYFWGIPLIQKNKDIATQENTELFMKDLNEKIIYIANHGGRDQIKFSIPGTLKFSGDLITIETETTGTKYFAVGLLIPLGKNNCTVENGIWGKDEPATLCVRGMKLDVNKYHTTYTLKYIRLDATGIDSYRINLTGSGSAGESAVLAIENKGTTVVIDSGRSVSQTQIEVKTV